MIGLSATDRWAGLYSVSQSLVPVLVETDSGKFVAPALRGLNAERPQSSVDRHVRRVCRHVGRVCQFSARSGKAGAENDRLPVPGNGGVDTVSAEELTVGIEHHPSP